MSSATAEPIISTRGLCFSYNPQSQHPIPALRGIDLDIFPGEYLVIIGHNGSGKSTLARQFNALLQPTAGHVVVKGLDTRDPANTLPVRRTVGMVFQVPDNQIVATVVEEDVAFGPENLGLPDNLLHERVEWALELAGVAEHRHRQPHRLSAGQKQRVALAGVMAMKPEVLVLDEATSMLDPEGRREVLAAVRKLNDEGTTVVAITHFMNEATEGDRVAVLEEGRLVLEGTPRAIFSQVETLRNLQLDVPQATEMAYLLNQRDASFPPDVLSVREFVTAVLNKAGSQAAVRPHDASLSISATDSVTTPTAQPVPALAEKPFIEVLDLHHTYLRGTPLETVALRGISLQIQRGEAVGIIGRAGAGKSTLVQHLNGLLRARESQVRIAGQYLSDPRVDVRRVRQKVGLVFQYPEQQLFERLVGDDIAFGLKKLGLPRPERVERVHRAMTAVGLDFETFKDRYTFSLSGGEMRKAALAGVLALQPEVLILDESTSGLDPRSRREILDRLMVLHRQEGLTLVFVSPSMEDVAELVDRVYVLDDGRVVLGGSVREVFAQEEDLSRHGLAVPQVAQVAHELRANGIPVDGVPLTVAEGVGAIWKTLSS